MTHNPNENKFQEQEAEQYSLIPLSIDYIQSSESFDQLSPIPNHAFPQSYFQTLLDQQPDTCPLENIPQITQTLSLEQQHKEEDPQDNIHQTTSNTSLTNSRYNYHWDSQENDAYVQFIQQNLPLFLDNNNKLRRKLKIFVLMSDVIGTRNESQCRSHHQKCFEKYRSEFQRQLQKKLVDKEVTFIETFEEVMLQQILLTHIQQYPSEDFFSVIIKLINYLKQLPTHCHYTISELLQQSQNL